MIRQLAKYGAGLIALYIVVYNGTKFGAVLTSGADGASKLTKTLQGR